MHKYRLLLLVWVLLGSLCADLGAQGLLERVTKGDEDAVEEARQLSPKEAMDVLIDGTWTFSRQKVLIRRYPDVFKKLCQALSEIPGHGEEIRQSIERLSGKPAHSRAREGYFLVLAAVASEEAIEAAGSFLFDDYLHPEDLEMIANGTPAGANSGYAFKCLARMNLADAPTKKPSRLQSQKEQVLWKEWWKKRQGWKKLGSSVLVPKEEVTVPTGEAEEIAVQGDVVAASEAEKSPNLIWTVLLFLITIVAAVLAGRRGFRMRL